MITNALPLSLSISTTLSVARVSFMRRVDRWPATAPYRVRRQQALDRQDASQEGRQRQPNRREPAITTAGCRRRRCSRYLRVPHHTNQVYAAHLLSLSLSLCLSVLPLAHSLRLSFSYRRRYCASRQQKVDAAPVHCRRLGSLAEPDPPAKDPHRLAGERKQHQRRQYRTSCSQSW